jgi:septum formation protein
MTEKSFLPFRLLLASKSPRRRAFFELLGVPFEAVTAEVDETPVDGESSIQMVRRLSLAKAHAVAERADDPTLVVGADTTVVFEGQVLGKPSSAEEARRMLLTLRDRPHEVHTGVSIVEAGRERDVTWSVTSVVWMRPYRDKEIESYVASGDPFDKAGGYAIQHPLFHPVARIEGCYANVMGMPLCHLVPHLVHLGLVLGVDVPSVCAALTGHPCTIEQPQSSVDSKLC